MKKKNKKKKKERIKYRVGVDAVLRTALSGPMTNCRKREKIKWRDVLAKEYGEDGII